MLMIVLASIGCAVVYGYIAYKLIPRGFVELAEKGFKAFLGKN